MDRNYKPNLKTTFYILILVICSGCGDSNKQHHINDEIVNDIFKEPQVAFPEYELSPKDTVFKDWQNNGHSETIEIGKYKSDTADYRVITKFSLIPVADGLRGKSILYLISHVQDTLEYRTEQRTDLPIDIYKNQFVFKSGNKYVFAKPEILNNEIICFGQDWGACFTG